LPGRFLLLTLVLTALAIPAGLRFKVEMSLIRYGFIALLVALILGSFGAGATAGRFMTGGFMGLNVGKTSFTQTTQGPAFAGSLGFRLSPQWRIEGEVSYTAGGMESGGEVQSRLALMNLYYDVDVGSRKFKPFLSFGAGMVNHDIYRHGIDGLGMATESMSGMAWQAGAGLNYQLNDNLSFSGGYRHVGGAAVSGNGYAMDPDSHEIRLGVKYKFPVPKAVPANLP
jgi:opacity protein-like surface antigen